MVLMTNTIALVEQVGLLLPPISAVATRLLSVSVLSCIRAMLIVRCESTGFLH